MSGGYRAPVLPIFGRALDAIDGLEKLMAKARWRMTKKERAAVEAASDSIVELRDELREKSQQLSRLRAAIGTLMENWKEPAA